MTTEIVLSEGSSIARVNVASDLPAIFKLAGALVKAPGFIPQHLRNEGEIAAVILAGMELGLQPMVSLRSLSMIKGKVVLAADVQLALMVRAGARIKWLSDGSDGHARLEVSRPGQEPHVSQFSLEMAKKAGLTGDNWQRHPAAMMRARCVSSAARAYMPDVLAGCYVPGEIEGSPDSDYGPHQSEAPKPAPLAEPASAGATTTQTAPTAATNTPEKQRTSPAAGTQTTDIPTTIAGWLERHNGLMDRAFEKAGIVAEDADVFGLHAPRLSMPRFSEHAKVHAGKGYDEMPAGFLREVIYAKPDFDKQPANVRLWVSYLTARHECRKLTDAAAEAGLAQAQAVSP